MGFWVAVALAFVDRRGLRGRRRRPDAKVFAHLPRIHYADASPRKTLEHGNLRKSASILPF